MDHFAKISKIGPSNAAVLDMLNGKITGSSGTLVIDESLLPKLRFIKEGSFKERGGLPTLKLIGDVKPVTVVGYKKQRDAKDKGPLSQSRMFVCFPQRNSERLTTFWGDLDT